MPYFSNNKFNLLAKKILVPTNLHLPENKIYLLEKKILPYKMFHPPPSIFFIGLRKNVQLNLLAQLKIVTCQETFHLPEKIFTSFVKI